MKAVAWISLVTSVLGVGARAQAANWSLGASLGCAPRVPDHDDADVTGVELGLDLRDE
jgi:hypothetical protein